MTENVNLDGVARELIGYRWTRSDGKVFLLDPKEVAAIYASQKVIHYPVLPNGEWMTSSDAHAGPSDDCPKCNRQEED